MKLSTLIHAAVIAGASLFSPPTMSNSASFQETLAAHLSAIARRDSSAFENTLTATDTLTFIAPNGKVTISSAEFKKTMRDWFGDKDWSWQLVPICSHSSDSTGVAVFNVTYTDLDANAKPYVLKYVLSLVFAREVGGWKLVHDQNTLLK